MKYKMIEALSASNLTKLVQAALDDGWYPYGSPISNTHGGLYQAVTWTDPARLMQATYTPTVSATF
jgi:hypothetical protein